MALVAYDNSDSSEYEDDNDVNGTVVTPNSQIVTEQISSETKELSSDTNVLSSEGNLFNLLPQPSSNRSSVIEEDDEFLHKKENVVNVVKPKAKITVPSLSDFKDVENSTPNAKPRSVNCKKSGLLSILPQPKNGITISSKSLIPNVLTQKPNNTNFKKKDTIPQTLIKNSKVDIKPLINDYSDESDNEEVENDFFSINKPVEIIKEAPTEMEQENTNNASDKKPFNIESYFKVDNIEDHIEQDDLSGDNSIDNDVGSSSYGNQEADPQNNEVVLDDEALMKLCGTRAKRKREDIQIVDINQKEVLADAKEWLLKGLMDDTTKRVSASKKKGHEPTNQQKRKHQITYLAYQAKANEADLQNQWANNRMSKRQTQSKYGF